MTLKYCISLQTFLVLKYKKIKFNEKRDIDDIIITNLEKS